MFTVAFWKASAERALKTGAQFALAAVAQDWTNVDWFEVDLPNVGVAFVAGVAFSLLTSAASSQFGTRGSPSLAAEAEVEAATG